MTVSTNEDVGRLDVSVNDTTLVQFIQSNNLGTNQNAKFASLKRVLLTISTM